MKKRNIIFIIIIIFILILISACFIAKNIVNKNYNLKVYIPKGINSISLAVSSCEPLENCDVKLKYPEQESLLSEKGTHKFDIVLFDEKGNTVDKQIEVTIVEEEKFEKICENTFEYTNLEEGIKDFNGVFYKKYDVAVAPKDMLNVYKNREIIDENKLKEYVKKNYSGYIFKSIEYYYARNKYNYTVGEVVKLVMMKNNKEKHIYIEKGIID